VCTYIFVCVKASPIFTETLKELRFGRRRIVHQGGQYSGKTVNILMALATLCAEEDDFGVTTVTAQSFPHIKGGALRDFEQYVYPDFKSEISSYNKTDHVFTFKSGCKLEFRVFENEMAARGHKRKRLFVNEANSFNYMVFFQLDSRSDQTVIDYNPSLRFWAHEKLLGKPETKLFISDHRHNPFLTEEKHREIESYTGELFNVYARGLTGNVQGVIFPYWQVIDDEDFPEDEDHVYSIDFGYTNDPTAIIKQVLIGRTLFVKEIAYETGMPVKDIVNVLKANGYKKNVPLYCEHDPDMIRALRNAGLTYATPARKGQGSVNAGIELLNTYKVFYTASSKNLHRERSLYIWETDKEGRTLNVPVDRNNHCFDAIRYGVYTRYLRFGEKDMKAA